MSSFPGFKYKYVIEQIIRLSVQNFDFILGNTQPNYLFYQLNWRKVYFGYYFCFASQIADLRYVDVKMLTLLRYRQLCFVYKPFNCLNDSLCGNGKNDGFNMFLASLFTRTIFCSPETYPWYP